MQLTGTVVFWRDDRGFGFVLCDQTQQKLFFHIREQGFDANSAKASEKTRPSIGDTLQFQLGQDKQQRDIASQWQLVATSASKPTSTSQQPTGSAATAVDLALAKEIALYFRCGFLILIVIALLFGTLPYILPILYLEASLFTYWLYRADKQAAIARQGKRLPEQSLQLFSFIGGWPGAYIAQKKLSHKNSKWLFQREFALIILGNSVLVIWLLSNHGQEFIGRLALFAG